MVADLKQEDLNLLHEAIVTRMHAVNKLIASWHEQRDANSLKLIEWYSADLKKLEDIEVRLIKFM